jgi:hypothetical protein
MEPRYVFVEESASGAPPNVMWRLVWQAVDPPDRPPIISDITADRYAALDSEQLRDGARFWTEPEIIAFLGS